MFSRLPFPRVDERRTVTKDVASEETRAVYPFDFRLDVRFRIDGINLTHEQASPRIAANGQTVELLITLKTKGIRWQARMVRAQRS